MSTQLKGSDFLQALNPFDAKGSIEAKDKIYQGLKNELSGIFSYFSNDGADNKTIEKNAATSAFASAINQADNSSLITKLSTPKISEQQIQNAGKIMSNWARARGYDGFGEYAGNYYLKKGDEFIQVDEPGIMDSLKSSINELGLGSGAIMALSSLPWFKGANLGAKVASSLLASGLGAGAGRAIDGGVNANTTNTPINAKDYANKFISGVNDDITLGGVASLAPSAIKGIINHTPTAKILKSGANVANDIISNIPTANIAGAKKASASISGDNADEIIAKNNELGGLDVNGGNHTDLKVLNKGINLVKNGIDKFKTLSNLSDDFAKWSNDTAGLDKDRKDLLATALGDKAQLIRLINAIEADSSGQGIKNIIKLGSDDTNLFKQIFDEYSQDYSLSNIVNNYFKGVGDDFGRGIDEIKSFVGDRKIKLSPDEIKALADEAKEHISVFDASSQKVDKLLNAFDNLGKQELSFDDFNKLRKDYNRDLNKFIDGDNSYESKRSFLKAKEILDNGIKRLIGDDGANAYYESLLGKYAKMADVKNNPIFKTITDKNSSPDDVINAFIKANDAQGGVYDEFVNSLSPKARADFEVGLIKHFFDNAIGKIGDNEILNSSALADTLGKFEFKSNIAKKLQERINTLAQARGNISPLLESVAKNYIKPRYFKSNLATSAKGAAKMQMIQRLREITFKYIPALGNDEALKYHLIQASRALKSGKGLDEFKQNIIKDKNIAPQSKKALFDYLAEYKNIAKFEVSEDVRQKAGISSKEQLRADLKKLADKHPEMFKNKEAVADLISFVLKNPDIFSNTTNPNGALIMKNIDNKKMGDIGIFRDNGEIFHANKRKHNQQMRDYLKNK